jgi:hypothetical protein
MSEMMNGAKSFAAGNGAATHAEVVKYLREHPRCQRCGEPSGHVFNAYDIGRRAALCKGCLDWFAGRSSSGSTRRPRRPGIAATDGVQARRPPIAIAFPAPASVRVTPGGRRRRAGQEVRRGG